MSWVEAINALNAVKYQWAASVKSVLLRSRKKQLLKLKRKHNSCYTLFNAPQCRGIVVLGLFVNNLLLSADAVLIISQFL